MTRFSAAAVALATAFTIAVPAYAQMGGLGDKETPLQKQDRVREEERKAVERDYEKTMKRLKSQNGTADAAGDPWAIVRPTAAPAKPEAKNDPKKR